MSLLEDVAQEELKTNSELNQHTSAELLVCAWNSAYYERATAAGLPNSEVPPFNYATNGNSWEINFQDYFVAGDEELEYDHKNTDEAYIVVITRTVEKNIKELRASIALVMD